jgi:ubiquinone biosynthesis UbiH/UbiF/VisC/COQ6 family hydroxylase
MQNAHDVLIVGAGPVGLCFARALSQLGLSVVIIDKQTKSMLENPPVDGRDIALTHFSVQILKEWGAWQYIPEDAVSCIREARVYNGTSSKFMELATPKTDQLAFIVSNHFIRAAAYAITQNDPNIRLIEGVTLKDIRLQAAYTEVALSDGNNLQLKLLVAADSRFSDTRKKMGIPVSMQDFGKVMVVCQMQHTLPHQGIAQECFLYHHTTLAALPLTDNRSSIIITVQPKEAEQMIQLPTEAFNVWIAEKLQHRLGDMQLVSERYAHPLVSVYPKTFIAQRFALMGDAAVGMHPVTAHGFNFGLKGQHTLSVLIQKALNAGRDIGGKGVLMRYQHAHQKSTRLLYLMTNTIVGLYTNDSPPMKMVRSLLLRMANKVIPIKSLIMSKLVEKQTLI